MTSCVAVATLCVCFATALEAAPDKVATKTVAAKTPPASAVGSAAAKPVAPASVAKVAAKPAKPAKPAMPLVLKAPEMVGAGNIISPDKAKQLSPDKGKSIASAKSFTEQMKELEKKKNGEKKPKPVRMRKQVVDGKVCVWAKSAEDAEMYASEAVRKFVGKKSEFQMKDSLFYADGSKYICLLRFNYTDEMPETWYLETEMVTGFGKTRERAYSDAMSRAAARVKTLQKSADWKKTDSSTSNATEMGIVPYDYMFSTIGKESYCKVFFRYFMPR